ncbi:MAG: autotransporter outer membrane beta-barrel domain-containing protein [Candidatus Binatia bacterium]
MTDAPRAPSFALVLLFVLQLVATAAAQDPPYEILGPRLQRRVNAALTLMTFAVVPDLNSSFLSIDSGSGTTANPEVRLWQFGSGFTLSQSFPLWLEGSLGYNRYDPTFVFSNGTDQRTLPVKWNTISVTAGIGWDLPVPYIDGLVLRPIVNGTYGHVESDVSLAGRVIDWLTDKELDFLAHGRLNAWGVGGSAMLDYARYRDWYELDVEVRYTNIPIRSFDTSSAVSGNADAEAAGFWSRFRFPTGLYAFRRPLRSVFEASSTYYLGDQAGVLGFNYLSSVGAGIEFDISAVHLVFSRIRFLGRYAFGEGVSGAAWSISLS